MSSYVKGGAWTSIEDEILKAAVQKYGTNQWARVSSLLPKKTAAQAKSRWVEWLNPLISKSGWTSEQDKRLIELTRLLPNQWRSIASIIGRTATQCIERYQLLIDEASGSESNNDLKLTGPGIETLPAVGQPTAQIIDNEAVHDPNFAHETQPAKLESDEDEDMEDDDREMLAEAKARLSNTQGKKAKRKARERMLDESKRLALLQKRRDMKAAGLNISLQAKNKRAKKEFDYNADIPHEIVPPAGPYDVSEENRENEVELEQFLNKVAHLGMSLKEIDDKIDAMQEKSKVEKKRRRKSDSDKDHEESNLREEIEFKRQKGASTESVTEKKKPEITLPTPTKKPNKALALVAKAFFEKLPEPKHHNGVPAPIHNECRNGKNSVAPSSAMADAIPQRVALCRKGTIQRVSQVIQRDLVIPDPHGLKKWAANSKDDGTQKELAEEFKYLIAADYRMSKDPSFCTSLVVEVNKETFDKVSREVEAECIKLQEAKKGRLSAAKSLLSDVVVDRLLDSLDGPKSSTGTDDAKNETHGAEVESRIQNSSDAVDRPRQSHSHDDVMSIEAEIEGFKQEARQIFDRLELVRGRLQSNEIQNV